MSARVLITGGAGYIGSVVVEELIASGAERVVVLDDLSKGHAGAVVAPAHLVRGDIADGPLVERLCKEEGLTSVVHLAASSLVGESVTNPAKYYRDNVVKGLALLDAVVAAGVRRFVFSSTAAVYGEPAGSPITEDFPSAPTNTYGETKLAFEKALSWYARAHGIAYASLRYFNAAGATAHNGEQHVPETHLIPLVLAAAYGARPDITVFGEDYPTKDGTCVRDYIHVSDLARAHVLAIDALGPVTPGGTICNLGCGGGFSVAEVIDVARRVTGKTIVVKKGARRDGDPAVLVASSKRAREVLSWEPRRQDLSTIVGDAWRWYLEHPNGYDA
ncbi:MAG: UDP-glucose 4-epimerase GalE [Polyangiaceae bacterium]